MRYWKRSFGLIILLLGLASIGFAEDDQLQYFLAKASAKDYEPSKKEKTELLAQIEELMGKAQRIQMKLTQTIQAGEMDILYPEGKFWMSKLEEDRGSIETGIRQLKLLKERPTHLVSSITLYKSLKDLSSNFNAYNNMPSFSAYIGDLAPEIELWTDPVFYKLYLLPLARLKDVEAKPPQKEKKPVSKEKSPSTK
jgi:hypothetical protein